MGSETESSDRVLVSYVVPTFNRAHCVARAIDSVLGQRAEVAHRFEVIVVDDGSSDTTSEVLSRYDHDGSVKVIRFAANRGLGHARNAAFANASGRWCALLDSDNALLPGAAAALERILAPVEDDIGVVWAGGVDSQGQKTIVHSRKGRIRGVDTLLQPLGGEHFSLIRRDLALRHRYPDLGTRHACEPAYWAALAQVTNFWVDPEPLQYYETGGTDRFCAVDSRLGRAGELATCYRHTASIVARTAPRYRWELLGKAAFYRCIGGSWPGAIVDSIRALAGVAHVPRNLVIAAACIGGPGVCRWLLRRTSGAQ